MGEKLNIFVLGLNESSTEEEIKKPIFPCLFDFTVTKIFMKTLQK